MITIHDTLPPPTSFVKVGVDIETYGMKKGRLHRPEGRLASLQISIGNHVYMIYEEGQVQEALGRIQRSVWCIHNANFDMRQLRRWSDVEPSHVWDTMVVEQMLWGGYYRNFALMDLVRRYMNVQPSARS